MTLLSVDHLRLAIKQSGEEVYILRGVILRIEDGQRVGLVGESGSGKTMTARTIMRLLPRNAVIKEGDVSFKGQKVLQWPEDRFHREIRGREIAIIFQDARAALNPLLPVGRQVADIYTRVHGGRKKEALAAATEMLRRVALPNPERIARAYPHELSGGMCQRVIIAMALICSPTLLIGDEPTSGLDVTIQVQILDLILEIIKETKAALLLISHDMSVISKCCTNTAVMYCGQIVEVGPTDRLLREPLHPYTRGLVKCFASSGSGRMPFIPGLPPDLRVIPPGCPFAPRCEFKTEKCLESAPSMREVRNGRFVACHKA